MVKNSKTSGWVFLLLFSLPFIGFGSGLGYSAVSCLVKWQAMKSWEEVPATIQSANLDVKRKTSHSKGRTSTSTTYKVTASYIYNYNGTSYRGTRVTMHSGSDSFSYHRDIYKQLSKCKESGQTFPSYVNPDNPSEAILFRVPRWEKVYSYFALMLLFGGVGIGLFYAGLRNRHTKQQEDKLKVLYPSEPWLWKKDWRDGQISSHSKSKMISTAAGALIWNIMASLGLILLYGEFRKGNYLVLIFLIFPLIGIGLAIWAVRLILHWFKFGQSSFEMQSVPGVIGGALRGRIHTKVNIKPQDGFHLTLSCINRVTTGSGKHRKTREHIRWQDTCDIAHEMYEYDPSRSVIPVLFSIPYDNPETSDENPKDKILWRLKVSAKVPGVDYTASFEIPVFRTPQSSKDFVLNKSSISGYKAQQNPSAALETEGIRAEALPSGGKRYIFPGARNKRAVLSLLVFLFLWTGVVLFLFKVKAPIIFPIIFGFIDIILLWAFLDMLLFKSRIDIEPRSLSIAKGLFVLKNNLNLNSNDIEGFKIKSGMTFGNRLFYNLNVTAKNGQNYLIAKSLTNRRLAENLAGEMEKLLLA